MEQTLPRISPKLLTTKEAAELAHVSQRTVLKWIENGTIPYLVLPQVGKRKEYRIPMDAFLRSFGGNYDLAADVRALDQVTAEAGLTEEQVLAALADEDRNS
jgi:excisionase family DNA binding protein